MKLASQYVELARRVAACIPLPRVTGIHLPVPVAEAEKADEFGFVFLQDGSVGPFYTSLDDTLPVLWRLYPDAKNYTAETLELIECFASESQAKRAVALGAFNAMSHHVMKRARYSPVTATAHGKSSAKKPAYAQSVAIVGFIRPLVEKLLDSGKQVLVLEKNPARVVLQPGLQLSTDPADLRAYDTILCTASTLINDTLGDILQYKNDTAELSLIGPSGSGLPDILFQHGVDDVGGIYIHDVEVLQRALDKQESWGHAGQKYQLSREQYPGVDKLLETILEQS